MQGAILIFGNTKKTRTQQVKEMCLSYVESLQHPDVYTVEVLDKKASIGIKQVRNVIRFLHERPYSAKHKVVIFFEAERITTAGQNALLKTLEEPPGYAVIILSAKTEESLLPTVVSRCQKLNLSRKQTTQEYTHMNLISDLLSTSIGERLAWTQQKSTEEKDEIIEMLEDWIVQERENMKTKKRSSLIHKSNIQKILKVKKDLEETNVNLRLSLEYLVLNLH